MKEHKRVIKASKVSRRISEPYKQNLDRGGPTHKQSFFFWVTGFLFSIQEKTTGTSFYVDLVCKNAETFWKSGKDTPERKVETAPTGYGWDQIQG